MKKTILSIVLNLFVLFIYSQSIISKRIEITNPSNSQLLQIKNLGIDLSCGAIFEENKLILELGESELNNLQNNSIPYKVLIDDLILYYKNKFETELPIAKAQLASKKSLSSKRTQKSVSTKSTTITNLIQHEDHSEIDWDANIPNNFNIGASFGGCLTYSEVLAELDQMRALYPNLISVKTDASPSNQTTHGNAYTNGGTYDSWSGQTIYYVRISDNPDSDENEPESLFTGMTHSREVSSMMNLMYFMWYVLENYNSDPGIKNLVDNHEMYFIPVVNPDGLLWNEQIAPSGGGLQRKNLGPYNTGNHDDRGVDLNRNFDYFWGSNPIYGGSSGTQSSNTYRGPSRASEPETQIMEDFVAGRNFKTALNHHATSNLIPHAYNGYPDAPLSGREAEYHKMCHDMTRFNRYIYGQAPDILTVANGDMSDWMLGGATDVNGSHGSGKHILAMAPENGAWNGSEGGFWPDATEIVDIAQRAMRMNFVSAYHSGKFARFHDLNTSDINTISGNLEFGVEYLGQTLGDISLSITPVSANINSISSPPTQSGWSKLEQRTLTAAYTLDSSIQPNDEIEFQVTLSNDDGYIMYRANIIKFYTPTVLFSYPDTDTLNANWVASGASWGLTTDVYSGTSAITESPSGSYSNNINNSTLTLNTSVDLSSAQEVMVQFFAKWDIERNFDYVQLQGSTNGSTWIPLGGKYTKPGSDYLTNRYSSGNSTNNSDPTRSSTTNQPSGELLYDGDTMDKWVLEEIAINATENNFLFGSTTAQFRFVFDSDNTNRADKYPTTFDGFTFDDFKIVTVQIPCNNSTPPTSLSANTITVSSAILNWSLVPSATYDLRYRQPGSASWIEVNNISSTSHNLTGLSTSTDYEVQVRTSCTSNTSSYSSSYTFTTATPTPCTGTSISSFPYSENFDAGIGDWSQGTGDDGNWSLNSGGTPSGGTGPTDDFNGSGNYFYVEASLNQNPGPGSTVYLVSPCIDLSSYEDAFFSFYYHMYGSDMGSLNLDVSIDNGSNWTTLNTLSGQQQSNQNDPFAQQIIDLSAYNNQVIKLRFRGTTLENPPGNTNGSLAPFRSDMAIDQISLTATESCSPSPEPTNLECWETANFNDATCSWEITGSQPTEPTNLDCWETASFNDATCSWEVTGSQPAEPTNLECWETANFNDATCSWEVTGSQPAEPTNLECWETANFNNTTCSWEVTGSQPIEPTNLECWETANFNNSTCSWEVTGSQPIEPTNLECWETANFNDTTCSWEITGSQPAEPTNLECWETANFNDATCSWEVTGSQPAEPTNLECWETANFNNTTCSWEVTGSQPAEPTNLECWETANFNNTTCSWEVTGSQPAEPTNLECWETANFNDTTCSWEVTGSQPAEPTNLECWETTNFNDATCSWEVTGSQPAEPTNLECWETANFNNTTCSWEVTGSQPIEPTNLECWETANFNDTTCSWEVTGSQPAEPTNLECWETANFNDATCSWEVTGSQPMEPTNLECWETANFNNATCSWEVTGSQPSEPTNLECWETANFNNTTCSWEVTGSQPSEPTNLECWETANFNNTTCSWEVTGSQPTEPTNLECWETANFNDATCSWEVTGSQPAGPTNLECWETVNFNDATCSWEVTGSQPMEPTNLECWETANFNNATCSWEVTGSQPTEPTNLECWETASFNNTTCSWEITVTGTPQIFYKDNDNDGYGDINVTILTCSQPIGYVTDNTDCNDSDSSINPGAIEISGNGIDDDCNPVTPDGTLEIDEDFNLEKVNISPNPFKNNINIGLPLSLSNSDFNFVLTDINGRLIFNKTLSARNGKIRIPTSIYRLDMGVYIILITEKTSGRSLIKKLIKN